MKLMNFNIEEVQVNIKNQKIVKNTEEKRPIVYQN